MSRHLIWIKKKGKKLWVTSPELLGYNYCHFLREGVTRSEYEKDGWIAKVLEKRQTIAGTCWYQLNHCSIRRGSKKSHAVTWFGACSYRKLKLINGEDVGVKHKCPICACDLVRVRYLGDISLLISRRGETLNMFGDDGAPLWEIVVERKFKSG